jgi:hypothetical protein
VTVPSTADINTGMLTIEILCMALGVMINSPSFMGSFTQL